MQLKFEGPKLSNCEIYGIKIEQLKLRELKSNNCKTLKGQNCI
jgi:hypothetical protein